MQTFFYLNPFFVPYCGTSKNMTTKYTHYNTLVLIIHTTIQGVSKFDRQTFRADSRIKNKHKTLNTYGVKNA
jgi:hypothetical protein